MMNLLTRKLELFGPLPEGDKRLLDRMVYRFRRIEAHQDIISEGEAPSDVHLIMSGIACRQKYLRNGERQIIAFLLPGDFCDLHVFVLKAMDHDITANSECHVVDIPRQSVLELLERPAIARALWWVTLVDEAILREWIVNIGQRNADERIAHLFCELHLRMVSIGLAGGDKPLQLPLTQRELAAASGLSVVHVNRSLQSLRARGLIQLKNGMLTIPDGNRLRDMCGFQDNYLHLGGGKRD